MNLIAGHPGRHSLKNAFSPFDSMTLVFIIILGILFLLLLLYLIAVALRLTPSSPGNEFQAFRRITSVIRV